MPDTTPLRSGPGHLERATTIIAGTITALLVLMINAGGLASGPLHRSGLIWPTYLGLLLIGVATATLPPRRRATAAVWLFLFFWAVFGLVVPHAWTVAPDADLASREIISMGYSATLSVAMLLCARRAGPLWWRTGWLVAFLLTGGIAVWELTTNQHLWITPSRPFPFGDHIAVATFVNPNNFGIVLLCSIVAGLAMRAATCSRALRLAAAVIVCGASTLVLLSGSRAAVLGLLIVAALELRRYVRSRGGSLASVVRSRPRLFIGTTIALVIAAAVSVAVPQLRALNPVYRMLYAAVQPTTGESDLFRLRLARLALRYWKESGYWGTGAGSYEPIMWNDPDSGISIQANLHNGFLELLSQYGFLPAVALALVLLHMGRVVVQSRFSASMRPRILGLQTELLGYLVAFMALGLTASSSLAQPVWWLMLANAAAVTAALLSALTRSTAGTPPAHD